MKRIEYRDLPRARELPPGPWDDEPDKVQWPDEATGLPCVVRRGPMGVWCGYVGVPPNHPFYELDYSDVGLDDLEVHGGLTFSNLCDGDETGICHVTEPGEPDPVWWLGFDCGHFMDLTPGVMLGMPLSLTAETTYRDLAYVTAETERLAAQIAEVGA